MLNKIQQLLVKNHPATNRRLFKKTYDFLNSEIEHLGTEIKQRIKQRALRKSFESAQENASLEFISAGLLFDLIKENTADFYKRASKRLGPDVALLVCCYDYGRRKFQEHNLSEKFKHSYRTALLAAKAKLSAPTICAILLHDLPFHTPVTIAELAKEFDEEIIILIETYEKIRRIPLTSDPKSMDNLREMILSMAKDMRVIILKICSNIDYLKNPGSQNKDALKSLARESMEVLAPISDLLGMWNFRWQLEDYAFRYLKPSAYRRIAQRFEVDEKKHRDKYIKQITDTLAAAAKKNNINCKISGRFKHFYSIYQKMKVKQKSFDEISDVFALRVVVDSVEDCYRMLGIIHGLWRPILHRVKDYIASPKDNHYRSLHTTVWGINNRPTEFQIRTYEMNEEARYGIASHWQYKLGDGTTPPWAAELLKRQKEYQDPTELLENLSADFLANRIYVYTPKGDIVSLPKGATPVDFAYRIHSKVGHELSAAKVNNQNAPLSQQLKTNDLVQLITDRKQTGPKLEWLNFVKTTTARKHIERYFNKEEEMV